MVNQPTLGYLVWRLSMKWRAAVDAAVGPLGLTHAQYSTLASLRGLAGAGGAPPSQRELADHTGLDAVYVSKLAKALEQRNLIRRVTDERDSRAVRLTVTEHGAEVIERAMVVVGELQSELAAPLGGTSSARTDRLMNDLRLLIATPLTTGDSL